jgi:excisionase family DNA binding protein
VLSLREVAADLGVSTETVRRLCLAQTDPIPAMRLGDGPRARWRVPRAGLEEWKARHMWVHQAQVHQMGRALPRPVQQTSRAPDLGAIQERRGVRWSV